MHNHGGTTPDFMDGMDTFAKCVSTALVQPDLYASVVESLHSIAHFLGLYEIVLLFVHYFVLQ